MLNALVDAYRAPQPNGTYAATLDRLTIALFDSLFKNLVANMWLNTA